MVPPFVRFSDPMILIYIRVINRVIRVFSYLTPCYIIYTSRL
jgi:hypothetical protein